MKVTELMTKNPACVTPDSTLQDAAMKMKDNDCGSLPVENAGRLVGVITDRDIVVRAIAQGKDGACKVSDVMSKNPRCATTSDDVDRVQEIMAEEQVRRVPVVDGNGKVVGMIAQADLALAAGDNGISAREVADVIEEVSKPN